MCLIGDSAGGNFVAAVALKLRDNEFQPAVKMQVLIYPIMQGVDFKLPSYIQNENGPLLTRQAMAFFTGLYLEGNSDKIEVFLNNDHVSPQFKKSVLPYMDASLLPAKYLVGYQKPSVESGNATVWKEIGEKIIQYSPLVASRFDNLPPAYVFTAEYDPLRDEGILYVLRLRKSGIRVEHDHSDFAVHGILSERDLLPEADEMFRRMTTFVAGNL